VLVLLLFYSADIGNPIYFDTGAGNECQIIDICSIGSIIGNDVRKALPALHVFTGCERVCVFVCKGKKPPFQRITENCQFVSVLQQVSLVGDMLSIIQLYDDLECFVCHMYGSCTGNDARQFLTAVPESHWKRPAELFHTSWLVH